jgi:sugar lactone lactonase YvrE
MTRILLTVFVFFSLQPAAFAQEPPITKPVVSTIVTSHPGAVGGLITDQLGFVYIADFMDTVWRLNPHTGKLLQFATGFYGSSGNTLDKNGNLIQSSYFGNSISRISRSGEVVTLADDGLNGPVGMIFNQANELLVCNCNDQTIKKVDENGNVTDFAKSPDFNCPNGISKDSEDNMYVVSFSGSKIVKITPEGTATVFADSQGNGLGHIAMVNGVFYASSFNDNKVFRITSDGALTLLAGTGNRGQKDGAGHEAEFSNPNGIYGDSTGRYLYINDYIGDPNASGTERTPFSVRRIELPNLVRILDHALEHESIEAMETAYQTYTTDSGNTGEKNMNGMNNLGWKYLTLNRFPEAVAVFELNVIANPDSWRVYSSMGAAYMKVNENQKAIEVLQKSLELNPENMVAKGRLVTLGAIEE